MREYKTKNGKLIQMRCFTLLEEPVKSRLFDSIAIEASIDNEIVGFVKLTYISEEKAKKLQEPFDYFIYKIYGSDDKIVDAYEQKNYFYLLEKFAIRELKITKEELDTVTSEEMQALFGKLKEKINKTYDSQFKSMREYWVNKPNIELVKVFTCNDKSYTDYSSQPYYLVKRTNNFNWQGQGIGAALYEHTVRWCQEKGLELWGSNNQTNDAIRMWKRMEKMPHFCVIMTNAFKYTNSGEIINIERPKVRTA